MKRSKRMAIVRSVAEHEEKEKRMVMGNSQRDLDVAMRRLAELKGYREQYATSHRPPGGAGAMRWKDFHHFMTRLDQAVAEQEQVVRDGHRRREAHRNTWQVKRRRLETLSRIVDRFRDEELEIEERQQQKLQDALPRRPAPFVNEDS